MAKRIEVHVFVHDPHPVAVERGEPDARTRQVLQVSAENDRLRRQVAAMHAEIRRLRDKVPSWSELFALFALLPPEQRDRGDEADCVRDEP